MSEIYYKVFERHLTEIFKDSYPLSDNFFKEESESEIFGIRLFNNNDFHPSALKWDIKNTYHTKEKFDENFKNPLSSVMCNRIKVIVTKTDEKVSIKLFTYHKLKKVNTPYYKVSTECRYLTYSIKRGVFYSGKIINYHKKRKFQKSVKVVGFSNNFVNDLMGSINLSVNYILNNKPEEKVNLNIGHESLTEFVKNMPGINYDTKETLFNNLYKFYLEKRNVKIPNNWNVFSGNYPQPVKKDIIKNKFKLIESIMDVNKLKGDKLKKVLHLVNHFNVNSIKSSYTLFGTDFIHSQTEDVIKSIVENQSIIYEMAHNFQFVSKKERNNIFEIFKLVLIDEVNVNTFIDHYNMIRNIRRFENIRWNSYNYISFLEEHLDLTEKIQFFTKGIFKRQYVESFVKYIEQTLTHNNETFHPKILTTSNEYNTESFVQSNCVKGYINKAPSIIISLRKNDIESKERATIEIQVTKGERINLKRVQTLGRFNKSLDNTWEPVLEMLDNRLKQSVFLNLFELPKIECKIGHKTFTSDSHFVSHRNSELSYTLRAYDENSDYVLGWVEKEVININGYGTGIQIPIVPQILEEDF